MSRVETLVSFFGDRRPTPAPSLPSAPDLTEQQSALVAQACSKSGVIWVRPLDEGRPRLAWHVWHDGAVNVVYGVGEQMLPLLSGAAEVIVPSKDTRTRLISFVATAQVLPPRTPEWDAAASALAVARLNAPDPATQRERWATAALITRLVPLHVLSAGPGAPDAPAEAAPPPPSAGTTSMLRPRHLGGRSGRARRQARDQAAGP